MLLIPFFIHLAKSNFNWVFKISKKCLFVCFASFNWVFRRCFKTLNDFTVCFRHIRYFQFGFQECLFLLKIENTILNPGLTHL